MSDRDRDDLYLDPDLYDLFQLGVAGDVEYFVRLAKSAGKVLELASGTGRVTIPMAKAGAKVTGIELRKSMLDVAAERVGALPEKTARNIELYEGDMRGIDLGRKFPLIVIPFRAFSHLHEVADQRACLGCCRDHLTKSGRLVINVFDPNLKILAANLETHGSAVRRLAEFEVPGGRLVVYDSRLASLEEQLIEEQFIYEKFDGAGNSVWRKVRYIHLRYFFRYEMEHLLELCGLRVAKLEGDFKGGPFRHGGEQIWTVARD